MVGNYSSKTTPSGLREYYSRNSVAETGLLVNFFLFYFGDTNAVNIKYLKKKNMRLGILIH